MFASLVAWVLEDERKRRVKIIAKKRRDIEWRETEESDGSFVGSMLVGLLHPYSEVKDAEEEMEERVRANEGTVLDAALAEQKTMLEIGRVGDNYRSPTHGRPI